MPIHPTAIIDPLSEIHPTVIIGPHAVIEGPVRIGADCTIAAFAAVLGNTEIGPGCRIHSHAVVGDYPQDRSYQGQETYCRIGSDCVIREGATVHRATTTQTATTVGDRCLLMTNSHVGHDCVLENDVTLISGALLGGHVAVGSHAIISGNAAVHQFVRIGELAMVSGLAKVVKDVPPFFMTDRDGAAVGVNRLGLHRAGFPLEDVEDIKAAYRIIYRSGSTRGVIVDELRNRMTTTSGRKILEFMTMNSRRGVAATSISRRRAA